MSYLVKNSQAHFTDIAIGPWVGDCFGQKLQGGWNANGWRKNNQTFHLWGDADYAAPFRITYGTISWSPDGVWTYGPTSILKRQTQEISGSAYLLDNSGHVEPLEFAQDEEIDLFPEPIHGHRQTRQPGHRNQVHRHDRRRESRGQIRAGGLGLAGDLHRRHHSRGGVQRRHHDAPHRH